jgi:surface protein
MSVSYYKGTEIPEMNYNITVDAKLQEKAIDITVNGSTVISPDSNYDALSGVTVNVNVPSSGGGESSGEGIVDLGSIGYTDDDIPDSWKEGLEYAKEIQENWDSSKTSMSNKFSNNKNLVFMPMVDTSNVTSMNSCFDGCSSLTTIPELNTSKVTSMSSCFDDCFSLQAIPELDTSNVTSMDYCFYGCNSLQYIPELDTSNVTSMNGCFNGCSSLTTIPELNTSKVTNIQNCFSYCSSLTTIPQLDLSKVRNINGAFSNCSNLIYVPELNTVSITTYADGFSYCTKLKRIEGISFKSMGSLTSSRFLFGYSSNIPCSYILIKDIGTNSSCTSIDTTYARVWGIADDYNPDARQSLIDSLLTYSFDRRTAGYSDCTIKLYSNVKALLTEDEINSIQAKGYIIS